MSWDEAKTRAENHKGNSKFLKLDDGEKVVGVFVGEPFIRDTYWNDAAKKYEPFTKELEKAGKKATPHYLLNVYVIADDAMRVFDMSNTTFKDLLKVKDKYGLDKKAFEIEREGKGNKTSYSILVDDALTDELRKKIAAAELHDLSKLGDEEETPATDMNSHDKKTNGVSGPATNAKGGSDEPPVITAEQAKTIVDRVKPLDKAKQDAFLGKFKLTKVKLLPAGLFAEAVAYLDELEGKKAAAAPAAAAEEVDPFA